MRPPVRLSHPPQEGASSTGTRIRAHSNHRPSFFIHENDNVWIDAMADQELGTRAQRACAKNCTKRMLAALPGYRLS